MESLCNIYTFIGLIKDPNCFINPENPLCINLLLTSNPCSSQNSCIVEAGNVKLWFT